MLKTLPCVFAVGNEYHIMAPTLSESCFWVEVDGKRFCDEQNGAFRYVTKVHKAVVPMEILDKAKKYTVCEKEILEHREYASEVSAIGETVKREFKFYPLPENNIKVYHIADAHAKFDSPIKACKAFGEIDLLVLNGDLQNHSGTIEDYFNNYEIAAALTKGEKPIVFSRGNHDMRGLYGGNSADFTPTQNGNCYYTFRLGNVWGMVLDCGEDKADDHPSYCGTICCHDFRLRQTEFIKNVIENAGSEYGADGVKTKLIISHVPFTKLEKEPFDIDADIYAGWGALIKENIKPDLMLCGHVHVLKVCPVGGELDNLNQPCDMILGSAMRYDNDYFAGCGLLITDDYIESCFTDYEGNVFEKCRFSKNERH